MRILHKLLLGMVLPATSIALVGMRSANVTEQHLLSAIESSASSQANAIAQELGRVVETRLAECRWFSRNDFLRAELAASNAAFEGISNLEALIDQRDQEWRAAGMLPTPFMLDLQQSELAEDLRKQLLTLEALPGTYAFGEVFVTNRFGVNVAQSNRTSDYRQNDEDWWRSTWTHGSFVGDVEFDKSAAIYSMALCTRIEDDLGVPIGVMKAVLSLHEIVRVLDERVDVHDSRRDFDLMLLGGSDFLVHRAGDLEPVSLRDGSRFLPADGAAATYERFDADYGRRLVSHAKVHLRGVARSPRWRVVLEHDYEQSVAPAADARAEILGASLLAALVAALLGSWISLSLSRRIGLLQSASVALGDGDYKVRVALQGNDELGDLGATFNRTALRLQQNAVELEKRAVESEAAATAKGEFLASVSHELRTPMNGILGMSSFLLETELDKEQHSYVGAVAGCAENLLSLINDILDLSKLESDGMEFERLPVHLARSSSQALDILRPTAEASGLSLDLELAPGVPEQIISDPSRLRQVLLNLLGNAVKFTQAGSVRLCISAPGEALGFLRFEVIDTGIGIAGHKLSSVFERFTQADASVSRKYGGTGLGLAISRRIVQGMGGEMGVDSTLGKGSTFWFHWPYEVDDLAPVLGAAVQSACLSDLPADLKVLVAEDNPVNRLVIGKQLRNMGLTPRLVNDGLEALEAAKDGSWDVILMDCHMPNMDGFEATTAIRGLGGETSKIRIIALTASAMPGDRERCLAAGMDDYMTKPASVDDIRAALSRVPIVQYNSK